MNNIEIIYRKELLDTIRDRRTIISMIVVPILLFPLLTIGFTTFTAGMIKKSAAEKHKVAVIGKEHSPDLYALIDASDKVEIIEADSIEWSINNKIIRAALVIPEDFDSKVQALDSAGITLIFSASEARSNFAAERLEELIEDYRNRIIDSRLSSRGVNPEILEPFEIISKNIAEKKMGTFILSMFLPYIIILLSMLGAMYAAIDVTAGEKERGTMETILATPIPRWQLATGKFLVVVTSSLVSTILTITSMSLTTAFGIFSMGPAAREFGVNISFASVLVTFLMMVPTACLFSALLMSISLFARSYREAQSNISPLMLLVILPALVSLIPGVELDFKLAFVPVINICLVVKEALMGNIKWLYVVIIFLSAVVYASFAIFIAHRLFEKESVIFRS
jgi:sodium transport system permease protein